MPYLSLETETPHHTTQLFCGHEGSLGVNDGGYKGTGGVNEAVPWMYVKSSQQPDAWLTGAAVFAAVYILCPPTGRDNSCSRERCPGEQAGPTESTLPGTSRLVEGKQTTELFLTRLGLPLSLEKRGVGDQTDSRSSYAQSSSVSLGPPPHGYRP